MVVRQDHYQDRDCRRRWSLVDQDHRSDCIGLMRVSGGSKGTSLSVKNRLWGTTRSPGNTDVVEEENWLWTTCEEQGSRWNLFVVRRRSCRDACLRQTGQDGCWLPNRLSAHEIVFKADLPSCLWPIVGHYWLEWGRRKILFPWPDADAEAC